ncbi:hypothetical protein Mal15_06680 [Stieleria maiorica]|uniref:Uncharacterized protein n=1 Tax=Stieleria maiorica TaxID=2795974 RepID=A0A5B9M9C8_9BACT|nr:hypothetical protein Mal15_06680 [Stieleria maiorica]
MCFASMWQTHLPGFGVDTRRILNHDMAPLSLKQIARKTLIAACQMPRSVLGRGAEGEWPPS